MSTIKVTNIKATGETASRSATGVAAAYVTYAQQDNIIKTSLNISSQTDDSTGRTTSSFTSSFSSVNNYCVVGQVFDGSGANDARTLNQDVNNDTYTASAVKYYNWDGNGLNDGYRYFVSFLGDLA